MGNPRAWGETADSSAVYEERGEREAPPLQNGEGAGGEVSRKPWYVSRTERVPNVAHASACRPDVRALRASAEWNTPLRDWETFARGGIQRMNPPSTRREGTARLPLSVLEMGPGVRWAVSRKERAQCGASFSLQAGRLRVTGYCAMDVSARSVLPRSCS